MDLKLRVKEALTDDGSLVPPRVRAQEAADQFVRGAVVGKDATGYGEAVCRFRPPILDHLLQPDFPAVVGRADVWVVWREDIVGVYV